MEIMNIMNKQILAIVYRLILNDVEIKFKSWMFQNSVFITFYTEKNKNKVHKSVNQST